jgi:PKHD-type hydroxylase
MDLGSYFSVQNLFTKTECDRIIRENTKTPLQNGSVVNGTRPMRKNRVKWIEANTETDWIYQRISKFARDMNEQNFKFELDGKIQLIQFTEYDEGSFYNWHVDVGPSPETSCRKLSVVVQLSSSGYDGGELQFGLVDDDAVTAVRDVGSATIFPSIMRHRVNEVTRGKRYSLVAWVTGPSFK